MEAFSGIVGLVLIGFIFMFVIMLAVAPIKLYAIHREIRQSNVLLASIDESLKAHARRTLQPPGGQGTIQVNAHSEPHQQGASLGVCSSCGRRVAVHIDERYCPRCGAKLRMRAEWTALR
jgi:hypothetical protein